MSQIETLRASTTIRSSDRGVKDVQRLIQGLFLSIQLSNPDHDIDWSTVNVYTETDQIDTTTFAQEQWEVIEDRRMHVEVKGVKSDG